jgi:hypothetical protein
MEFGVTFHSARTIRSAGQNVNSASRIPRVQGEKF